MQRTAADELVVMGGNQLDAYDPTTGKQLWYLPGLVGGRTITGPTSPTAWFRHASACSGPLHAVKPGARGELITAKRRPVERNEGTPDSCLPGRREGLVWMVTDNGI